MKRTNTNLILASVACAALALMSCSHPTQSTGNGSGVGNGVAAMLYNPGGSPAAHAKVRFYPIHYNPRTGNLTKTIVAAVDSTTTDAKGNYTAKLDTGTYNVLAAGDSGVVYQDSITVIKDSTVHPPADTLGAPGSIKGVVRLQPGDDARTVFIIFMGTNILSMPDDAIGNFTVANIAEGTYRVRILTTLDAYVPKDTVLSVAAGRVDTLTHDIVLQYTGIPVPSGLKISYDTLKQIVALSWNKPTTGRKVAGYNIYRKRSDSTSFVSIKSGITDTVYSDSTGTQDQTYEYRVAAVDTNGTEGVKNAGPSVKIQPAYGFVRRFAYPDSTGTTPYHIETDKYGNIFILQNYTGLKTRALKFDSNFVQDVGWGGKIYDGATDVAIDSLNRILIINLTKSQIDVYSADGTLLDSIKNAGVFSNSLSTIGMIDVANGKIFVLGVDNIMKIFDYTGIVIDSITLPYFGYFRVSNTGSIFMSYAYEILEISNGNIVNRWGRQGSRIGEFQYARQLRIDNNQKLFVDDEDNFRIQAFDLSGAFYLRFSLVDFGNFTVYSSPPAICVSRKNNNLLVGTDSGVLIFSRK
jgi:hypothetical protein